MMKPWNIPSGQARAFSTPDRRVEDGPVCFGDDWPGLFLRGDSCILFAEHLERLLDLTKDLAETTGNTPFRISRAVLVGLLDNLQSPIVKAGS